MFLMGGGVIHVVFKCETIQGKTKSTRKMQEILFISILEKFFNVDT